MTIPVYKNYTQQEKDDIHNRRVDNIIVNSLKNDSFTGNKLRKTINLGNILQENNCKLLINQFSKKASQRVDEAKKNRSSINS